MTWNPFDWTAGPFLTLYVALAVTLIVLGIYARATIGPAARVTDRLSVLELAYLAGGARRLGDAMLLRLLAGNGATIAANGRDITVADQAPLTTLMSRLPILSFGSNMTRQHFQAAVKPVVERIQTRLQELGYSPTDEQMASFRMSLLPFVGLLLMFGTIKAFIGAERHHPVGFLIVFLILTAIAGIVLATRPARTRAGKDALRTYQVSHARASRAPLDHELLLAVALSGAVVLSGTAYAPVYAASQAMSGTGSGCGSGGDGGGGCGGGGGGCGGCS
ncbi:TIGR04222 domain-containing membrane protein [Bradyrhizobium jicamae]|uniref:TIGR04222 domain-containing membrane protein n=1 Tax=Bradyrhizobium jicamae TaxID=280332 RepID=A0ABS5FUW7_9BRAD|nr:TIGR04222 domain-containing membrane protein [Bradyrhizobium jicamae]MBR0800630.1 TIGR04222 domain-containing membrane protein [Bradyrhizobium jicamae]MBR0933067.1 TIGR04222 domain-containing membrane protein [Bradyrhizobium jicamae]